MTTRAIVHIRDSRTQTLGRLALGTIYRQEGDALTPAEVTEALALRDHGHEATLEVES